jgi:hypothetical protein
MLMEKMNRSAFNTRYHYRFVDAKDKEVCGNCRHYWEKNKLLTTGCGLMLECFMTHRQITVSKRRCVCDLWQEGKNRLEAGK